MSCLGNPHLSRPRPGRHPTSMEEGKRSNIQMASQALSPDAGPVVRCCAGKSPTAPLATAWPVWCSAPVSPARGRPTKNSTLMYGMVSARFMAAQRCCARGSRAGPAPPPSAALRVAQAVAAAATSTPRAIHHKSYICFCRHGDTSAEGPHPLPPAASARDLGPCQRHSAPPPTGLCRGCSHHQAWWVPVARGGGRHADGRAVDAPELSSRAAQMLHAWQASQR